MKVCKKCGLEKENLEFTKGPLCKYCRSIRDKSYREKNKENNKLNKKISDAKYQQNNKEKIAFNHKKYSKLNKAKIKETKYKYYVANKKTISIRNKQYRENNKEKCFQQGKKYRKNNKEIIKIKKSKYYYSNKNKIKIKTSYYYKNNRQFIIKKSSLYSKTRYNNDLLYRLRRRISWHIWSALNKLNSNKDEKSCLNYLPYSIQELKNHLESLFEPWMNWNNYGSYKVDDWKDDDQSTWRWSIDHIIPQSHLLYSSMEDDNFQKCWALTNLRPYSSKQNTIDGAFRNKESQ
jgi:hypothetical protein